MSDAFIIPKSKPGERKDTVKAVSKTGKRKAEGGYATPQQLRQLANTLNRKRLSR